MASTLEGILLAATLMPRVSPTGSCCTKVPFPLSNAVSLNTIDAGRMLRRVYEAQAYSDVIRDGRCGIGVGGSCGVQGACHRAVPTADIYATRLGAWYRCVRWDDPASSRNRRCHGADHG